MVRLAAVLYILAATVLAGAAVTAVLAMNLMQAWQIAAAFGAGCVLALPIAYILARKIYATIKTSAI